VSEALSFTSDFPGGNARQFVALADRHYAFEVDLHGGERGLWFCFQVHGGDGALVTFDVRNATRLLGWPNFAAMRVVYGQRGAWQRASQPAEALRDEGIVRFSVPCGNSVFVAFCYPYLLEDLDAFRASFIRQASVQEIELLRSTGGYPVYAWRAGAGPLGVWLTCRQHAGESPASYVLEGFMRALAGPERQFLRQRVTVRVCPMVDVDNVQSGAYGKHGPPCDPYMDWSTQPVLPVVRCLQQYFAVAPEQPWVYIDLHSPEPCGSTFVCTWDQSEVPLSYLCEVNRLCNALGESSDDPLRLDRQRTRGYPQWFGDAVDRSSQGYFRQRHGCLATTLEVSYHWSSGGSLPEIEHYRAFGRALCAAIQRSLPESNSASQGSS